ncbi:MAG: hypothetical protein AB8I80_11700, partial [Anaerolineae bacterium]
MPDLTPPSPRIPRTGWAAFRTGISRLGRYPRLIFLAWAANLLAALLLAAIPAFALATGPGDRPVMHDLADGIDTWFLLETLMSSQAEMQLAETSPGADLSIGFEPVILWTLLALLVLPFLAWLTGAFLQGGVLLTYHDAPRPFLWRRFLWGCWHWWGAFLLLGAFQGLAALIFLLPLIVGAIGAFLSGTSALGWLLSALAFFANLLGLAIFERTRVLAVSDDTRNVFASFLQALRTLIRQPLPVAILYLLTAAAGLLFQAIHRLGLAPLIPLDAWLPVLLVAEI